METQLLLIQAKGRKNYYVSFYNGNLVYKNRTFFFSFYGNDYNSEKEAKREAIETFLRSKAICPAERITLTEHNGMQLAGINEPYASKSAIVKQLAQK